VVPKHEPLPAVPRLTAEARRGTRRLARFPGPFEAELPAVPPVVSYVVQTLVMVVAICALAVLVLYGARRIGVGRPSGPLALVGRLPLDGRRAVYLVRVGEMVYVVGASEAGLEKLGEISRRELGGVEDAPAMTFTEVLSRVRGARKAERGTTNEESKS
jgi:flagellar biogenesis protein FliO